MALPGQFSLKAEGPGNPDGRSNAAVAMTHDTRPPGLIQRYREALQVRHYARRTVSTYEQWLRRFLRFHRLRHPREMGSAEVNAFLSHLAVEEKVSASTQNQALAALLFLYRDLLSQELELDGIVRARTRQRNPVVLSEAEVRSVRDRLEGEPALVVGLLYGSGLRLMEALRLRVKDLDLERRELSVRDGKGSKDRLTVLPQSLVPALQEHLLGVRSLHRSDLAAGWGRVLMPYALSRKYPNASREWAWQWVFPQQNRWRDMESGAQGRHHLDPSVVQKTVKRRGRYDKGGQLPHLPLFVRDTPAGTGPGHPHHPGATRPQGWKHHHDLRAWA